MKRIIFINAHWNHLLMNTPNYYVYSIKAPQKYATLFNKLIERNDVEVLSYVSQRGNIIPLTLNKFHFTWHSLLEAQYVLKKQKLENKIRLFCDINEIQEDDVVIAFVHSRGGADDFEKMKGKKVVHLNQYQFHHVSELNNILPFADEFILEANVINDQNYISKAKLPQHYKFTTIPYIAGERFVKVKPFKIRKNKAVATGTIGICSNIDYQNFYNTSLCHKMRKVVYDRRDELNSYMDIFISPYSENKKILKVRDGESLVTRYIKKLYNATIAGQGKQKGYFSFNIVDKYNEYMMAYVPEEIVGLPAIGAFESMACGCAFIGLNHHMYTDLGLVPGTHYVEYDGTIENLKSVIRYYQNHIEELELIANAGYDFVRSNLNAGKITEMFVEKIFSK